MWWGDKEIWSYLPRGAQRGRGRERNLCSSKRLDDRVKGTLYKGKERDASDQRLMYNGGLVASNGARRPTRTK